MPRDFPPGSRPFGRVSPRWADLEGDAEKTGSPGKRADHIPNAIPLRPSTMARRPLGIREAGATHATPPLSEARHADLVPCHDRIDSVQGPLGSSESQTELERLKTLARVTGHFYPAEPARYPG